MGEELLAKKRKCKPKKLNFLRKREQTIRGISSGTFFIVKLFLETVRRGQVSLSFYVTSFTC